MCPLGAKTELGMLSPWGEAQKLVCLSFFLSVLGASDLPQRSCQKGRGTWKMKAPNEIYLNFLPYGVGRPRNGPGEPERQRHANLPAEAKK